MLQSAAYRQEIESLRAAPLIDYRRQWALKRKVLETVAKSFFDGQTIRHGELKQFLRNHPRVAEYARFRATVETQRKRWGHWPESMRRGQLREGDFARSAYHCYLYAQWQAHRQMADLAAGAKQLGVELYLDLPLGAHADGFDVWRYQDLFALDARGGAPPDLVFTQGQQWGFAPLHPQRLRETGYSYLIAVLRHHLKRAGMLRIDHVMGMHRLYWIPPGLPASEGTYVRYPAQELYAILCLESQRHQAVVVGENLGTVPPEVNQCMDQHHVHGMFVVQYELFLMSQPALRRVPRASVASLNTHDMPPFNAFWRALDIADRQALGFLSHKQIRSEQRRRQRIRKELIKFLRRRQWLKGADSAFDAVLKACFLHLAASPAAVLLLNLEDFWHETESQNTPGTLNERVNWRRKARFGLDEIKDMPDLGKLMARIARLRTARSSGSDTTLQARLKARRA
jgi:4-alpha-glucanotransferase